MRTPRHDPMDELFADFCASFREHVVHGTGLDLAAMRSLGRSKKYRDFVLVPSEYGYAYRLLWSVPSTYVRAVWSPRALERRGQGLVSHEVSPHDVNSWSVDLDSLRRNSRRFISLRDASTKPTSLDVCAVLLVARTHATRGRRRFWLNPDELYDAARADFAEEREVVSVGSVGRVWMAYRCPPVDRSASWDDLLDGVLADYERDAEAADEALFARRGPRRA